MLCLVGVVGCMRCRAGPDTAGVVAGGEDSSGGVWCGGDGVCCHGNAESSPIMGVLCSIGVVWCRYCHIGRTVCLGLLSKEIQTKQKVKTVLFTKLLVLWGLGY